MTRFVPLALSWALFTTGAAEADDPRVVNGEEVRRERQAHRRRVGLYVAGCALFGAGWGTNALAGAFAGAHSVTSYEWPVLPNTWEPGWDAFRGVGVVPLVGPWIQLALAPSGALSDAWIGWLIGNGAVQALGLTLFVWAATMDVPVVPTVSPEGAGLVVMGRL